MVTIPEQALPDAPRGNRRGQETRQRVLTVAARLFASNGYHATGMAELGKAANLGRGALYHHISTKEELLFEISMRPLVALRALMEAIEESGREPEETVRALSRALMESIAGSLAEYTVSLREIRSLDGGRAATLAEERDAVEAVWARVLDDGVRRKVFRTADPVVVKAVLGLHNYSYLWLRPKGARSPAQIADHFSDIVLHGISERPFDPRALKAAAVPPLPRHLPDGSGNRTRERIIEVATQLFAVHGYHATGMAQLSEATGLGSGALYYHILSKEELLWEISSRHVLAMLEYGEAVLSTDLPPEQKLHALGRGLLRTIAERRGEVTVFFREVRSLQGERYEQLVALRERYEDIWRRLLVEGGKAGVFRLEDGLTVKALLGLHNFSYLWLNPQGRHRPATIADRFAHLALNGLRRS